MQVVVILNSFTHVIYAFIDYIIYDALKTSLMGLVVMKINMVLIRRERERAHMTEKRKSYKIKYLLLILNEGNFENIGD